MEDLFQEIAKEMYNDYKKTCLKYGSIPYFSYPEWLMLMYNYNIEAEALDHGLWYS